MGVRLLYAVALLATAGSNLPADVVAMSPNETYYTACSAGNWMPGFKTYIVDNTSNTWVYWKASTALGQVSCRPNGGWIPPAGSMSILLLPSSWMWSAAPGLYNDRVTLDFDARPIGDISGDGEVDMLDVSEMCDIFGSNAPRGDFDGSGVVDIIDVLMLVQHYGQGIDSTRV